MDSTQKFNKLSDVYLTGRPIYANAFIEDLYSKYCPEFKGFDGGILKDDIRIKQLFDHNYQRIEYDNPLIYSIDTFIKHSLSGSYSPKPSDNNYDDYIK